MIDRAINPSAYAKRLYVDGTIALCGAPNLVARQAVYAHKHALRSARQEEACTYNSTQVLLGVLGELA